MIGLSLLVGLSLSLVSTDKENIRCPKPRVEAAVGDSVTLDCHLDPERDMTEKLFEWKLNGSVNVLVHRKDYSPGDQAEGFRLRVSQPSREKLSAGKLSVHISDLQAEDAGSYSCSVGKGGARISCSVELVIKESSSGRPPEEKSKGRQRPGSTISSSTISSSTISSSTISSSTGEILGVAVTIALAAVVGLWVLWRRHGVW